MATGQTDKDILRDSGQEQDTDHTNDQGDYDNGFDQADEVGNRGGETWNDPSMADDNDDGDDLDNDLPYDEEADQESAMDEGTA